MRTVVNHDPEFIDTSGKKLAKLWDIHDYLWFSIINQETDAFFKKNYNINSRLLKVTKNETHISIKGVPIKPSS